jgi:hypothetical protein
MKKFLLITAMLFAAATLASAQNYKEYFVVEEVGQEYPSWYSFKFDFEGKFFYHESDSEDEQNGLIKNYKENGNTRTFDVYPSAESSHKGGKDFSATFVTEEDGGITFTMIRPDGYKGTFKLSTTKPGKKGEKSNPVQDAKDKVNAKVKGALDKGLNAIKKKK